MATTTHGGTASLAKFEDLKVGDRVTVTNPLSPIYRDATGVIVSLSDHPEAVAGGGQVWVKLDSPVGNALELFCRPEAVEVTAFVDTASFMVGDIVKVVDTSGHSGYGAISLGDVGTVREIKSLFDLTFLSIEFPHVDELVIMLPKRVELTELVPVSEYDPDAPISLSLTRKGWEYLQLAAVHYNDPSEGDGETWEYVNDAISEVLNNER